MDGKENIENKKNKRKAIYIFIAILLALNLFLIFMLIKKNLSTKEELVSTTILKEELAEEVATFRLQLVEYEKITGEKDSALLARQQQIEELQERIEEEIKAGRLTLSRFNAAREEINQLKYYVKKYQDEIQELKRKNEKLTQENVELKTQVTEVKREVDKLLDENVSLSNKVNLGSMLRTSTIEVTGIQFRGGKQRESMRGDRIDGLRVSFNLMDNHMTKEGNKDFFVKILNPKGETLYMEERGSGTFIYQDEISPFTAKKELEFVNSPSKVYTIFWSKGSPFEKGNYTVQLFNEGIKIGENNFELK